MATTRNATVMLNKRCRVWHHLPGEWSVELTGDGYPKGLFVSDERLVELVQSDGWALDDPKHLVDLYGPAALREEYQDVARLDADAAGYGYRAPALAGVGLALAGVAVLAFSAVLHARNRG